MLRSRIEESTPYTRGNSGDSIEMVIVAESLGKRRRSRQGVETV
jgi:hypothetical protein